MLLDLEVGDWKYRFPWLSIPAPMMLRVWKGQTESNKLLLPDCFAKAGCCCNWRTQVRVLPVCTHPSYWNALEKDIDQRPAAGLLISVSLWPLSWKREGSIKYKSVTRLLWFTCHCWISFWLINCLTKQSDRVAGGRRQQLAPIAFFKGPINK